MSRKKIRDRMKILGVVLLAIGLVGALTTGARADSGGLKDFKEAFLSPPQEAKPWVYWYWMNGNITKEGVVEDLKALHRVGVGGAYLMDIGIHPEGPVAYRSPEWYEATGAVMKEAQKLNMEIGFHSPGWSASGGPWVTPDKGMQEVVWTETRVTGGATVDNASKTVVIQKPESRLDTYSDIAVIAIPAISRDENLLKTHSFKLLVNGTEVKDTGAAYDGKPDTWATLPVSFELVFEKPVYAQSVFYRGACKGGDFRGTLEAADDKGEFRKIANMATGHPGPFSSRQGASSFEGVESARFRFTFARPQSDRMYIEELAMTGGYRVDDWIELAGFGTKPDAVSTTKVQPQAGDVIDPETILDVTDYMNADGSLKRALPAGEWTVLRFGYVPIGVEVKPASHGGVGLECDKMSVVAADFHYDNMIKPLLAAYGKDVAGKVLAKYHVDSYEAGWQNWTPEMMKEFKRRRGYDLASYLPALTGRVVGDVDTTLGFLWDFRRTIGDLYADNHYGRLAERAHRDGIKFSTEPYGGPFEFLQVAGRCDFPMVEFWTGPRNILPSEQAGSKHSFNGVMGAHTYGKRIIGSEAFTSEEGWIMHPYAIKSLGDVMYASGINQFIIHVSAHQPYLREGTYPGFTSGINGIHFDRGNTWFDHGGSDWVDYLSRCQGVLQQGLHVADVLYFQGNDSPWGGSMMSPGLPAGYEGDLINSEMLARLRVKSGRLILPDGKNYGYLVMPQHGRVSYASLREVERLLNDGATIVGQRPNGSPSLADRKYDKRYAKIVEANWGGSAKSKGRILADKSFADVFARDILPSDFSYSTEDGIVLHYTHRRNSAQDVYFVANGLKQSGYVRCDFRADGGRPELWNPVDGTVRAIAEYSVAKDGRISIPLWFNQSDSYFVVFDRSNKEIVSHSVVFDKPASTPHPDLKIISATYGVDGENGKIIDVTAEVAGHVKDNELSLDHFERLKVDPVPGVVKTIRVSCTLDGKPCSAEAKDGGRIQIPVPEPKKTHELVYDNGVLTLLALENGNYKVDGKLLNVNDVPAERTVTGEWLVEFQKNRGAPESIRTTELKSLADFDEDGVKYFSGTAKYSTSFKAERPVKGTRVYLDLGQVDVIASVRLNGKDAGLCWKPPFRFDVTEMLKDCMNDLEVAVTTTWVNRLIGDEQFPDDSTPNGDWKWGGVSGKAPDWLVKGTPRPEPRRVTFSAFKWWKTDDALHKAGLSGPVRLLSVRELIVPGK